jgi:hypothetical protein
VGRVVVPAQSRTLVGRDAALVDLGGTIARGSPPDCVVGRSAPSVEEGSTRILNARTTVGGGLPRTKLTITSRRRIWATPKVASTCRSRSPCSSPTASCPPSWPAAPTAAHLVAGVG